MFYVKYYKIHVSEKYKYRCEKIKKLTFLSSPSPVTIPIFFKKIFFIYLFLERGEGREEERERNISVRDVDWLPLSRPPTWDLACNLGMCPD